MSISDYPIWFGITVSFVLGAVLGSFYNVVIWRLPRGESLSAEGSACPRCAHKLAWYDNIPILGWLMLLGRCRYCKAPITVRYPVIEAWTGLAFTATYCWLFLYPNSWGITDWALLPVVIVSWIWLSCMLISTMIDAELTFIPLSLPNIAVVACAIGLPAATFFPGFQSDMWLVQEQAVTTDGIWHILGRRVLPYASAPVSCAAFGGMVGVAVMAMSLRFGWMKHGLHGEADWNPLERQQGKVDVSAPQTAPVTRGMWRSVIVLGLLIAAACGVLWWRMNGVYPVHIIDSMLRLYKSNGGGITISHYGAFKLMWWQGLLALVVPGVLLLVAAVEAARQAALSDQEVASDALIPELRYPRRMAIREAFAMSFPVAGALIGYMIGGSISTSPIFIPAVHVLGGVLGGYLLAAGMCWAVRVAATFILGKEGMGMGDIHLMGAIGAMVGALGGGVVFFCMGPFAGLLGAIALWACGKLTSRTNQGAALPYGPYLVFGALVVWAVGICYSDWLGLVKFLLGAI